jgi:DNA-binding Lrp family transcriptional regulator
VDAIDEEIVRCLLRNARSPYAEIGNAVGLSAPAAKRRVDRLVATGAIRGFTALIDPQAFGWRTQAFIEVHCRGNPSPALLRKGLEGVTEVVAAYTVAGDPFAILHVHARDIAHLERALQRIREIQVIDHTKTMIVLSSMINRPRVEIDHDGQPAMNSQHSS